VVYVLGVAAFYFNIIIENLPASALRLMEQSKWGWGGLIDMRRLSRPPPPPIPSPSVHDVSHLNWLSALPSYEGRTAGKGDGQIVFQIFTTIRCRQYMTSQVEAV
jgi:hypothetical protein